MTGPDIGSVSDRTACETRARKKIRQAVEAKGWTIIRLDWEPIRPGGEKEGPEGGWYGEIRAPSGGEDWVMGYSWQDAVRWVKAFIKDDKHTALGLYP